MATGFESIALLIGTATLLGILAQKTHQPKVIAYILAGLVMGPVGLSIVSGGEMVSLFSELGLVFLLFLIGLEIDLDEIREVLGSTIGIAVIQMFLTFLAGLGIATGLGFDTVTAVFIGAAVMFSSTALVVKILTKRDEASTLPGRLDVGVLLVQDVAVVIILALLTVNFSDPVQAGIKLLEIFLMISVVGVLSLASSRYVFSRVLKKISGNSLAFFTHGVAWAFLFITIADHLNLSLEIGAFLAGIGIAQVPYSRELQESVRPLTDLFMAIFFMNFGISIAGGSIQQYLGEAVIASVLLIAAKFIILFLTIDRFKFTPETSFKASVNMGQISEFGLILTSLAVTEGYIDSGISGFISMVAILTMGTSAYLIRYRDSLEEFFHPVLRFFQSEAKQDLEIEKLNNHAVIIGYDEVSRRVCRELSEDYRILVIDNNPDNVEELSESEYKYIYGDFKHGEIRKGANLEQADFIINFTREKEINTVLLEERNEDTVVITETRSFEEASEMYDLGADYVIMENVLAGNRISEYLELYLEDRDLFLEEIKDDLGDSSDES
ncbi:cation:proton antiporter [Candidatus Nanosalina sp. VS9-1]|uniref:cation:proton antiporter n=1 Tax=Candidatus Nanosalina sp. VS9-1 TaxID=3388566 RepID=UPI0039E0CBAF